MARRRAALARPRRQAAPLLSLLFALTIVAPAGAVQWGAASGDDSPTPSLQKITGGKKVLITEAPWQVRLRIGSTGICGGSIIDAQRIVTAAHCTYDGLSPLPAGSITVVSGSSSFSPSGSTPPNGPTPPDSPVTSYVSSIRRHAGYVPSADGRTDARQGRDDVAVLTLSAPLPLDGVVRQPIALAPRNSELTIGGLLSVTGFGLQSEYSQSLDGSLYRLSDMHVLDPVPRTGEWNALYVTATSASGLDCSGDSGGPLVQGSGAQAVLVGLVAFSADCQAGTTSVFTRVSAGEIRDFIEGSDSPPPAPTGGRDILMTADKGGALPLKAGRQLSCSPGTWTASPQLTVTFTDASTSSVIQAGPSTTYAITAADIGRRISCHVRADTDGGVGRSPATAATPAVEAETPTTVPVSAQISVALRTRRQVARRNRSIGLTFRIAGRGQGVAKNVRACVTLPAGWRVRSHAGAQVLGRTVCVKRTTLSPYQLVSRTVSVRPGSKAARGSLRLKVKASADNAASAYGARPLRVV